MDAGTALSLGKFWFHLARDDVLIGVMHVPMVPATRLAMSHGREDDLHAH
jgi:hypothetical protein